MTQSKLEELSAEATQGEWATLEYDQSVYLISRDENVHIAERINTDDGGYGSCSKEAVDRWKADFKLAARLVNAYRSGELVARSGALIPAERGWRSDMENAPRDGTPVDLWIDYGKNGSARMPDARFRVPYDDDWDKGAKATWCVYRPHPDALHDWEWLELQHGKPTHWMLRPTPPASNSEK